MLITLHIVPVQHNDSLYYGNTSNCVASAAIKFVLLFSSVNILSPFWNVSFHLIIYTFFTTSHIIRKSNFFFFFLQITMKLTAETPQVSSWSGSNILTTTRSHIRWYRTKKSKIRSNDPKPNPSESNPELLLCWNVGEDENRRVGKELESKCTSTSIESSSSNTIKVPLPSSHVWNGSKTYSKRDSRVGPKITNPKTPTITDGTTGDGPRLLISIYSPL